MIILAITGSIAMGKSETAQLFSERGVPIWDADASVHRLYAPGGHAVDPIRQVLPEAVVNGAVDRNRLRMLIQKDPSLLGKIEALVHPLVAKDRQQFLRELDEDEPLAVLDIPLLFEAGLTDLADKIAVVSAPADLQRQRVIDRGKMTLPEFENILSKQWPDAKKRALADYVIDTSSRETARDAVQHILADLSQ